ncbi:MAG TPA: hypothetical protein VFI95_01660 [Terriglobales bacterium]|nr:hypothetical protein [Terriglobales bacterium]
METRTQGTSGSSAQPHSAIVPHVKTPRSIWILTAYGVSGLAVFGVLAYYFAAYVAH